MIEGACAAARAHGAGVAASRLVTGEHPAFAALEARIAKAKNQPAALVMASGYQTNLTAVAALADKEVADAPSRFSPTASPIIRCCRAPCSPARG